MGKPKEKNGSMKLFDDDSIELDGGVSKIDINEEFARRYEHNKKREDLQRLHEMEKKGVVSFRDEDSEVSSSEEEEDILKPSKKQDLEFFDALIKVKKQDPLLKTKEAKLFFSDSESSSEDENDNKNENQKLDNNNDVRKGKKPMYLKDVVSKHLIEEGPEFDDNDDDENDDVEVNNRNSDGNVKVKSYLEEQEESRREFLKEFEEAANVEDEEGDFLRMKTGKVEEEEDDGEFGKKLDDFFGEDEILDEKTKFLKDYFGNQLWLDNGKNNKILDEDVGFSEDEKEIEKQEDFERGINFRFEENAGDRVMGHSRKVEGSVRKKENARKFQRERKEERMVQAEFERNEELKHLKNLKKKEIKEKMQKIREAAGIGEDGTCLLDEDDLEEEFDPQEYDRKMKEAFDNKYYDAEDVNPEFGSGSDEDAAEYEKPDFDKEDRLLGLPNGWDEAKETRDGFLAARQRILNSKVDGKDESELVEDEGNDPKDGKRKRKRKPSEVEKAVREQLMEEYYKLDYEDTIGDLKTRFKYKPVKSKRFGLSSEEILMMDDKELNQYVSLKKLAPYREKEWKVPRIKTYQQKQRNKGLVEGETSNTNNKDNKKTKRNGLEKPKVVSVAENEKSKMEESNGDTINLSRRIQTKENEALVQRMVEIFASIGSNSKLSAQNARFLTKFIPEAGLNHQEEQGKTFDSLNRL
ncbi:KRR1 family protein [Forsythia ovata]|uniref:KRR1 family protein n=1 Tax=Forsythia ovata TaxID=205694 RepID=A0ABD1VMK7_9LAMI